MKEATDKATAFDNKFKKLGTDIGSWEEQLKKTKNARVKKELEAKLATAKKQKGQFDEMQKDAKAKLEKMQGAAKLALAAKEKAMDTTRAALEGVRNTAENEWKATNEAFNEAEAKLLDNKDAKLKAGLEKARDAAKLAMEAKKKDFDTKDAAFAPLRDEFKRRSEREQD